MDIMLLVKSVLGLLVLLVILVAFMALTSKNKKSEKKAAIKKTPTATKQNTDLEYLKSIVKNKKSTTKELKNALELVIKYHGTIHKKLGMRAHPEFDVYMDILFSICRHPNTNKDIIVKFDRDLERLNPEYKPEINNAIGKGLNSRGV